MPYLLQGGLGMPDRDYYVSTSPKMAALRDGYKRHVAAMLELAGFAEAAARAAAIVDLETKMAGGARDARAVGRRDVCRRSWTRDAARDEGARARLAGAARGGRTATRRRPSSSGIRPR